MRIIRITLFMLGLFIVAGCGNTASSSELSDIFASGRTAYWSQRDGRPAIFSIRKIDEERVEIIDLERDRTAIVDYKVENIGENIYRYSFRGGDSSFSFTGGFGEGENWGLWNVIELDGRYIFDRATEARNTYNNMTFEDVKAYFQNGLGNVVVLEE